MTVNITPEQDVVNDTALTSPGDSVVIDVLSNDHFEGDNAKITKVDGKAIAEGQTVTVADGSVKLVGGKLEFTPMQVLRGRQVQLHGADRWRHAGDSQCHRDRGRSGESTARAGRPQRRPGLQRSELHPRPELHAWSGGGYTVTVGEDKPFKGKITGKDPDGDKLIYELGKPPAHGTVTIDKNTGEYTYIPNKDWSGPGPDRFEVIVDDGRGGKTTTTVTVNITPEQDVVNDTALTSPGDSVVIDVLSNDHFEGDNAKITKVDGKAIAEGQTVTVADGSVKLVGGKLEFTPNAGFAGTPSSATRCRPMAARRRQPTSP